MSEFKTEKINDDYEWLQYNEHLRIIHSIKDDMFQMKSIIDACFSNKPPKDWFRNDSTNELLEEAEKDLKHEKIVKNGSGGYPLDQKLHENRVNLPNNLKGYYVHRLLVNHVAMWASPKYAWYIAKLLDTYFAKEREQLHQVIKEKDNQIQNLSDDLTIMNEVIEQKEETIEEQNTQIEQKENRIRTMKPRQVPNGKERYYKYMIWIEDVPPDNENDNTDLALLHLVRRNNHSFRAVNSIRNSDKCWFYRENLPIVMTPNDDIKEIVRRNLNNTQYDIKGTSIMLFREHLNFLHQKIEEYFDTFQEN